METPIHKPRFVAFCNPAADTIVNVDADFVSSHGLEINSATLGEGESFSRLLDDIRNLGCMTLPGSCGMNTLRTAQLFLEGNDCCMFGMVGSDEHAQLIRGKLDEEGILYNFVEDKLPTAHCVCLVTGEHRTLVMNLGASKRFDDSKLTAAAREHFRQAEIVYLTGHFVVNNPDVTLRIMQEVSEQTRVVLNLSAEYVVETLGLQLIDIIQRVDLLLGNSGEMEMLRTALGGTGSLVDFVSDLSSSQPSNRDPLIVVMTQAEAPIVVTIGNEVSEYEVKAIPQDELVDTTAGGDVFVGAFIAGLLSGQSIKECVAKGIEAAGEICRVSGFETERLKKIIRCNK